MLAFAWLIAGFGIMIQGLVDDGLDFRVFGRMLLSFILGSIALQTAELLAINPQMPRFGVDWVFTVVAAGGFYLSLGATYLLIPQAQLFLGFVLAGAWLFTGIGRFISILADRGATLYNFSGVIFEAGIGCLLLALLFGVI